MLASFHGGGIDIGIEEADSCSGSDGYDGSAAIITDLINNGAGIHAQTDRTGKNTTFKLELLVVCKKELILTNPKIP